MTNSLPPSPTLKRTRSRLQPTIITPETLNIPTQNPSTDSSQPPNPPPSSPVLLPTSLVTSDEEGSSKENMDTNNINNIENDDIENDGNSDNVVNEGEEHVQEGNRRELKQPTVYSRRSGQVRRMSSVLDLRMGSLAYGSPREWDTMKKFVDFELELVDDDDDKEVDVFGLPIPEDCGEEEEVKRKIEFGERDVKSCGGTLVCESLSKLDLSELMC